MSQTQNALSWANCRIELSPDTMTWTDVSGFSNSVKVDGGERAVSEFFTVDGDTPILTQGKRSALEVAIKAVYTEEGSDPFALALTAYEAGSPLYARWSPKGGTTGNFLYTTSKGVCTKPVYPQGAADSADALPAEVTIKVASIAKSVAA